MNRTTTYEDRRRVLDDIATRMEGEGDTTADAIRDALTDMAEYRRALIVWAWNRVANQALTSWAWAGAGTYTTDLYPRQPVMPYLPDPAPVRAILETIVFSGYFDGKRWRVTCEGIEL